MMADIGSLGRRREGSIGETGDRIWEFVFLTSAHLTTKTTGGKEARLSTARKETILLAIVACLVPAFVHVHIVSPKRDPCRPPPRIQIIG